jgi:hypothetical protein
LEERRRWKLIRNGHFWDYHTIKDGDIFRFQDTVKREREVQCIGPEESCTIPV